MTEIYWRDVKYKISTQSTWFPLIVEWKIHFTCCVCLCFSEIVRIYDGNASLRRRVYRTVAVPKNAPAQVLLVSIESWMSIRLIWVVFVLKKVSLKQNKFHFRSLDLHLVFIKWGSQRIDNDPSDWLLWSKIQLTNATLHLNYAQP